MPRTLHRGNFGSSFALVSSSCSPPSAFESVASPVVLDKARLSDAELDLIDRLRGQGKTASEILVAINRSRETRQLKAVSPSAMYDYVSGSTYARAGEETRGRDTRFGNRHMAVFDSVSKTFQKEDWPRVIHF